MAVAIGIPTDQIYIPFMLCSLKPKMCGTRARTFDFIVLFDFCTSVIGLFLDPFSSQELDETHSVYYLLFNLFVTKVVITLKYHNFEHHHNIKRLGSCIIFLFGIEES